MVKEYRPRDLIVLDVMRPAINGQRSMPARAGRRESEEGPDHRTQRYDRRGQDPGTEAVRRRRVTATSRYWSEELIDRRTHQLEIETASASA